MWKILILKILRALPIYEICEYTFNQRNYKLYSLLICIISFGYCLLILEHYWTYQGGILLTKFLKSYTGLWRSQNDHLVLYLISKKYTYSVLSRLFMAYFTRKKLLAYCWVAVTRKDFVNYFDSLDLLFTAWVIKRLRLLDQLNVTNFTRSIFFPAKRNCQFALRSKILAHDVWNSYGKWKIPAILRWEDKLN